MDARLEKLLASIAPERTRLENERRADRAINTFHMPGATLPDWPSFRRLITDFFRHTENILLGLPGSLSMDREKDFGRACRILMGEFGRDGEKTAALMALHGVEGGLYQVLRIIAWRLAEQYAANEVKARVAAYWSTLTTDEKFQAVNEYLAAFGHLLPEDVTDGGAPRVKAFFPRFLEHHSELLRRMQNVGRQQ